MESVKYQDKRTTLVKHTTLILMPMVMTTIFLVSDQMEHYIFINMKYLIKIVIAIAMVIIEEYFPDWGLKII